MVQEFILDDTMDGPLFPALFSLNMLLGTPQGRSYSQKQLEEKISAVLAKVSAEEGALTARFDGIASDLRNKVDNVQETVKKV